MKYKGLNDQFVLHFLVENKIHTTTKRKGKFKSVGDLRKYKDAIMWGALMQEELLPSKFYTMFDNFLGGYKKEFKKKKKLGLVDEGTADPITFPLYKLILTWCLTSNNIFAWFWTLMQWNLMARSASIDPLGMHNFKLGADSIIGKYDTAKADQAGERLSKKNIYANPGNWQLCTWTGMGIWCALNNKMYKDNEKICF